jgi:hypothetical protein
MVPLAISTTDAMVKNLRREAGTKNNPGMAFCRALARIKTKGVLQ